MKKITLLSLTALLTFSFANAQVVYRDIPDGQPLGLDFNNDGTNEFDIISQDTGSGPALGNYIDYLAYGLENNIHAVGGTWDTPAFVAQGFTVDVTNNWAGAGDAYPNGETSGGNTTIIPNTDQYMAVRFNLTPNLAAADPVYYGWVRVNIDNAGNVTYKDYAYETTAGVGIVAGSQQSLGINDITKAVDFKFYPNPSTNFVNVTNHSATPISKIKISDYLGRTVSEQVLTDNRFKVSNLSAGNYLVTFYNENTLIGTKKLVVN